MKTRWIHFACLGFCFFCLPARSEKSGSAEEESSVYVPIGKRDPLKRPSIDTGLNRDVASLNPLEKFGLEQYFLKAILRGTFATQAMFEDPDGGVHIVTEGTVIGRERGTVSRILNREVIVTERTVNYLGMTNLFERVLSLPADELVNEPVSSAKNTSKAPGAVGQVPPVANVNLVVRNVTEERSAKPVPASNAAGGHPVANSNIQTRGAPAGVVPPAPSQGTTVRGGNGNGLAY